MALIPAGMRNSPNTVAFRGDSFTVNVKLMIFLAYPRVTDGIGFPVNSGVWYF